MLDRKALREEFNQLHGQCGALLTKTSTEKRKFTAEEKQEQDRRYARLDEIKAQVEEADRLATYAFSAGKGDEGTLPKGKPEFDGEANPGRQAFNKEEYTKALRLYSQTGDLSGVHKFAIGTGTGSGALLPKAILPPMQVRRNYNAVLMLLAAFSVPVIERQIVATTVIPIGDDTGNAAQSQTETATSGTTADPDLTTTQISLSPTLYSSKQSWWSNTQIGAFDFDISQYVIPVLSKRIDKYKESLWTTKLLAGTIGKTLASASAITYAEWLAYEHSLGNAYRSDAGHIMADSAFQLVRGLVDSNGRPIMDVDPQGTFQYQIHGKPVFVGDYFPTVATTAKVAAFASAEAIRVMQVLNTRIVRYVEDPAHPDQTGFEIFENGDMGFDPNGVRLLKMG